MAFDQQLESDRTPSSSMVSSILLRIPLLLLGIILDYSNDYGGGGGGGGSGSSRSLERSFHTMIDQHLIRTNNRNRRHTQSQSQSQHFQKQPTSRKWSPSLRTIDEAVEEESEREEEQTAPTSEEAAATTQKSSSSSSLFRSVFFVSSISPRRISSVLRRYTFSLVRNVVFVAVIAVVHDKIDHTLPI